MRRQDHGRAGRPDRARQRDRLALEARKGVGVENDRARGAAPFRRRTAAPRATSARVARADAKARTKDDGVLAPVFEDRAELAPARRRPSS